MRLLILTKLNLSSREMAHMLGISADAIRKSRYRLRKKLNLEEENGIEVLIQEI
jgi:DNA-binding CsgD family transcriptional regulator